MTKPQQPDRAVIERSPQRSLVSIHGGHSAEYCGHARNTLDEVLAAYVERGFVWAGITEHMPAARDAFLPPEERAAGLSARGMRERFAAYFEKCRNLQCELSSQIEIFAAFETEVYSGYEPFLEGLIAEFQPDYIVGSVHHVHDVPIDITPVLYAQAAQQAGGVDDLYLAYFDLQYDLIAAFQPAVVGHFDLIRLFDPDYADRLKRGPIWERVERNLQKIRDLGLILDFNVRALVKGQSEPYVSAPILERAKELGIAVVPGDDSHSVETVGLYCEEGIQILEERGFSTAWRKPGT